MHATNTTIGTGDMIIVTDTSQGWRKASALIVQKVRGTTNRPQLVLGNSGVIVLTENGQPAKDHLSIEIVAPEHHCFYLVGNVWEDRTPDLRGRCGSCNGPVRIDVEFCSGC